MEDALLLKLGEWRMKKAIVFLCVLALTTVANADNQDKMEAAKAKIFNEFKDIRMKSVETRIAIESKALTCLQTTRELDGLKNCEETAHQAIKALRASEEEKMEALKNTITEMRKTG
jgi:hypothetical protein